MLTSTVMIQIKNFYRNAFEQFYPNDFVCLISANGSSSFVICIDL